ncbi:unnamed protein product [Leptidea sinapis]|uniref:Endonuclease/exonuclease/phosphatase domain-containing protein n=1 Tax=Leptidea sinapis TaxID=189913 RepID=A0A5E4QNB3_9NEOP|nr:unnamed protein product [Leptidea sinapis]
MTTRSIDFILSVYLPCDDPDNLVEFTKCLATIAAIIADSNVEAAFMSGDFNADPRKAFGGELSRFCSENDLICVDEELLPKESFTYLREAHETRSWLDHILTTPAARRTVVSVKIDKGVYCSVYEPLTVNCNFGVIVGKTIIITDTEASSYSLGKQRPKTNRCIYSTIM